MEPSRMPEQTWSIVSSAEDGGRHKAFIQRWPGWLSWPFETIASAVAKPSVVVNVEVRTPGEAPLSCAGIASASPG